MVWYLFFIINIELERAAPTVDWEHCWRLARMGGLGPDNMTFLFKLLHQILPTQERVARTKPSTSPSCKMPGKCLENLEHALIFCQANDDVGLKLLEKVRGFTPTLQAESLIRLELHVDHDHELYNEQLLKESKENYGVEDFFLRIRDIETKFA